MFKNADNNLVVAFVNEHMMLNFRITSMIFPPDVINSTKTTMKEHRDYEHPQLGKIRSRKHTAEPLPLKRRKPDL